METLLRGLTPRKGRPPRWLFPYNAERQYKRLMRNYSVKLNEVVNDLVIPQLSQMNAPFNDSIVIQDGFLDIVKSILALARRAFSGSQEARDLEKSIIVIGQSINAFNKSQNADLLKWAFGIDLFSIEPWAKDATESWVAENVSLIKSIESSLFDEIEQIIVREIRAGTRVEAIAKMLSEKGGVSGRRGLLIARDQVGKFNGQLARRRQMDAGISSYTWRTVHDERVRPTHKENDGKIFEWNKPPKTGNPGHEIQCRCYAEPNFAGLRNEK